MYVTLEQARKHLQLDDFFHEDDELILGYIMAAEDATAKRVNRPLCELVDQRTGFLAPTTVESILLLVGTFYNNREATAGATVNTVPLAFDFLADLDRKFPIG